MGGVLRLARVERSADNVILGFTVLNALLLLCSCLLWNRLADRLGLSVAANWLGFIALFVNFAMVRMTAYYPVLTDVAAATLGLLLLDLHLSGRCIALAVVGVIGSFVWPLTSYYAAALVLFPIMSPALERGPNSMLGVSLGVAAALLIAIGCLYLYHVVGERHPGAGPIVGVLEATVYLSIAISSGYLAWVVSSYMRLSSIQTIRGLLGHIRLVDFVSAAAVLIVPRLIVGQLGTGASENPPSRFFATILYGSVARPGLPFVAHAIYFGPAVLLLAFARNEIRDAAWRLGAGMLSVAAISMLLLISCESRQSSMGWPVLVLLLAVSLDSQRVLSRGVLATVALIAVASVKPWMSLVTPSPAGIADASSSIPADWVQVAAEQRRYFMHQGPYMLTVEYLWQGAAVLCASVLLWAVLRNRTRVGNPVLVPHAVSV